MKKEVIINKMETIETCPKTLTWKEPDYSKMYFEFQFKDGEKAKYRMDKDCHNLQQFLDRMNHFHDLEKENKCLKKQLNEARGVIKLYAKTTIGHKQDDGTYAFHCVSGEIDWLNPLKSRTYMETTVYDPRPAKKWLKKWGVK